MHALDELVARWRKNPDPESTLALCAHLGAAPESELIREVSSTAGVWHKDNHAVMLSVGRMHLEAGLLADAQAALLRAGKLSPHDAAAYRYLGEVLLRRGDAIRSERALARATELGDADPETHLWRERAIVFAALQKRQGMAAVADEVARTAPLPLPVSSRPSPHEPPERDSAGGSRAARRSRPPGTGRLRPTTPKGSRRRASTPPPSEGSKVSPQNTLLMGDSLRAPARAAAARAARGGPAVRAAAPASAPGSTRGAGSSRQPARAPALEARPAEVALEEAPDVEQEEAAAPSDTVPDVEAASSDPFRDMFADEHARAADRSAAPRQDFDKTPFAELHAQAEAAEERLLAEAAAELAEAPSPDAEPSAPASEPRRLAPDMEAAPSPEAVLLALAHVGLYETEGDVVPAWEAAPRAAPRRLWVMAAGVLTVAALGVGGYRYALGVQRDRLAQAQELGMQLATALESGSRTRLGATENDFQRLFELDSRGREPALLWLENRALHALIDAEPVTGIEAALQRARTVGIEEQRLVFGRLASSLVADDLPSAGATIAEWDERSRDDALYQLFSGAVLERAGNPVALERYTQATRLQPDLQVAHVFAARLALLTLGPAASKSTLEMACARLGSAPAADVLRALEWASSPPGASPAPPLPPADALRDLPASMALVAEAVSAVRAHREGQLEASKAAFERALGPTTPPALAAWIASRALELGEMDVARKASGKAADPAAPHARALAARLALADGRLELARAAARNLDPTSRDAVLIEAVSAYENLDGAAAARLVGGLPPEAGASATPEPLQQSEGIITGTAKLSDERLEQLAGSQRPWAALLAADVALDTGRTALAERLLRSQAWAADASAPAARLARLRRYQGQGAAALELAPLLLGEGASARSVAEAVLVFLDADRPSGALGALSRGGAGSLEPWLQVLVEAARGRQANAAKSVAALELPDKSQPVLAQVVALRALAVTKDRRGRAYQAQIERRFHDQPDVLAAAQAQTKRKR